MTVGRKAGHIRSIRGAHRPNDLITGKPIEIRYSNGLLDTAGNPAHAATFIRARLIVLDIGLRADHNRILWHEIFHFAWVRLGNPRRIAWEGLLAREWQARARGEVGWSAEWRKRELSPNDPRNRTRHWREYCCESFCDTGAWLLSGRKSEITLTPRWLAGRKRWFSRHLGDREIPI